MKERVLIVDDDASVRSSLRRYLNKHGYDVEEADSCASAEARLREFAPMVALIDYRLPDGEALTLLPRLRHIDPACTLFVLTGYGTIDLAVRAVKQGAAEFLTKPVDMPALLRAVQIGVRAARVGLARTGIVEPLFGESPAMKALRERIEWLRHSDSSVLFQGEEGTGRTTLARWLHATSDRAGGPYVEMSCQSETAERELFGFDEPGAMSRPGMLEAAEGGSLFVDNIDRASSALQERVLDVLATGRFRRVGSDAPYGLGARLFVSTSVPLDELVATGRFDADLAAWFRARTLVVPALRDRPDEIVSLARHLLSRLAPRHGRGSLDLSTDAEEELQTREWLGNVRELENVLESAILLSSGNRLTSVDLRFDRRVATERLTLEQVERRTIHEALLEEHGRVEAAAKRLGIPRSTLYHKIKTMGITGRDIPPGGKPR